MTTGRLTPPAPISDEHDLASFDCGVPSLNDWLRKRAVKNQRAGASRSYVVCEDSAVIGYYCLAAGAIGHDEAPAPLRRNMPEPIPVLVLGRLAIDHRYQNQGLGRALLRDAVLRVFQVADIAGVAALLVHALSEEGRRFYLSRGFVESPLRPMTLCLILGTAYKAVAASPPS
jgi:GNAT superfamily N-acetyltransferase